MLRLRTPSRFEAGVTLLYLRPSADVSDGGWTNELGGTTLWTSLDEATPDDADYIQSSENPSNDTCEVHISDPSSLLQNATCKFTVGKLTNNVRVIDVTVALMQGATQIASWTYPNVAFGFTLKTETLTGPEFASITDFTDLRYRITGNAP
jgi:hypothetical protein